MQTIKINSVQTGMRLVAFWVDDEFPAGEYRLVPVGEAADKDARIAELEIKLKNSDTYGKAMADDNRGLRERLAALEKQLAERDNQLTLARGDVEIYRRRFSDRLPGVMPEVVTKAIARLESPKSSFTADQDCAGELKAYYAPPAGHEWQPVCDANPITAEDVGRKVQMEYEITGCGDGYVDHTRAKRYILRPIAPPFVFTGEPGLYSVNMNTGAEIRCDVYQTRKGPMLDWFNGALIAINPDGTFAGGRITGRVSG